MASQRSRVPSQPTALSMAIQRSRDAGASIIDLTESNPTRAGIAYAGEAILLALSDPRSLLYEPSPLGHIEARAAVAAEWSKRGVEVTSERVVLAASTSEAYAHCLKLFCDPGDDVLVPRPSYPLFEELARYEAVRLVPYDVAYDGAWHVDVSSARSAMTARTRAILAVSPNNPTGSCLTPGEVRALAALGVPLVVDEVFGCYPVESTAVRSALHEQGVPMIVLDGLSKLAGLPQMKVAWMTIGGDAAFAADVLWRLELLADAFLSVNGPAQLALPAWLALAAQTRASIQERLLTNIDHMRRIFRDSAVTIPEVAAGWYAMARLPALLSEEEWVLRLLEDRGVLVQPGWFYDMPGEAPWIVASLLTSTTTFVEGCSRVRAMVDALA